jgi:glycosyltransferase involved in cell wall biosynthesis
MQRSVALVGFVTGGASGVSRYATALSRGLGEVASEYPDLRLQLLTTRAGAERVGPVELDVDVLPLRQRFARGGPGRILLEQWRAAATRSDLLHFFDLSGPLLAPRRPFVTTVHDVSVMHGYSVVKQAYKRRLYPWALRRARATVAISEFAKSEAMRHFGAPPQGISVIPSGPGFTAATPLAGGRDLGLAGPYLLCVGNLTASKNLPFLVRAFERANVPHTLVLAGRPGEHFAELETALQAARKPVRVIQDATDAELDVLYREAVALLLPSRYEGFAFTPLEAMSRGCPVLASDIPAVREVSGPGAMLLPVDDEEAWAAALERIATDSALRESLISRGAAHVATYSWQTTARRLCELFRSVVTGGHAHPAR